MAYIAASFECTHLLQKLVHVNCENEAIVKVVVLLWVDQGTERNLRLFGHYKKSHCCRT